MEDNEIINALLTINIAIICMGIILSIAIAVGLYWREICGKARDLWKGEGRRQGYEKGEKRSLIFHSTKNKKVK